MTTQKSLNLSLPNSPGCSKAESTREVTPGKPSDLPTELSPGEQGENAFHKGLLFTECPFPEPDPQWHWQIGWLRAQFQDRGGRYRWMEKVSNH